MLSRLSLSHLGIYAMNLRTIQNCHDRTYRGHKLQYFAERNLKKTREDIRRKHSFVDGEMIEGRDYEHIESKDEAMQAVFTFTQIMRNLHPLDLGKKCFVLKA